MRASIIPQLLLELHQHVVSFLPPNEVACTFRLLNKTAKALFRDQTTVHLSQQSPHHAFTWRWSRASGAFRSLTLLKRQRFLCLTAANGDVANLEFAIANAGCVLSAAIFEAAAGAGQLHVCQWLLQQRCPFRNSLHAAAKAGHQSMCEWLLAHGCPWTSAAPYAAARGGHVGLMEWLLLQRPQQQQPSHVLLMAVAIGCDLATLHRLHADKPVQPQGWAYGVSMTVLGAAAGSRTPDWRAKVEWLEARGYPKDGGASMMAAERPDAVESLTWLRSRGYPMDVAAVEIAAHAGNTAAVEYLLGQYGQLEDPPWEDLRHGPAAVAAELGHLEVVQALHARGLVDEECVAAAAEAGHLAVVAWLVGVLAPDPERVSDLMGPAASSGNVELLAWLHERGDGGWADDVFMGAVHSGCEEAMEWLVEHGCPMPTDGDPYVDAARNGDLSTLTWLKDHGCPWGDAFLQCVREQAADIPLLRWLLDASCPVDWAEVRRTTGEGAMRVDRPELAAWLLEEAQRRA